MWRKPWIIHITPHAQWEWITLCVLPAWMSVDPSLAPGMSLWISAFSRCLGFYGGTLGSWLQLTDFWRAIYTLHPKISNNTGLKRKHTPSPATRNLGGNVTVFHSFLKFGVVLFYFTFFNVMHVGERTEGQRTACRHQVSTCTMWVPSRGHEAVRLKRKHLYHWVIASPNSVYLLLCVCFLMSLGQPSKSQVGWGLEVGREKENRFWERKLFGKLYR